MKRDRGSQRGDEPETAIENVIYSTSWKDSMRLIVHCILVLNTVCISLFVMYHLSFIVLHPFLAGRLASGKKRGLNTTIPSGMRRFAIVIPAHDEESLIREALESAKAIDYPSDKVEIIVIADNCTDRTAEIVRSKGIRCEERTDDVLHGKPYALEWLFRIIDLSRYDAFVIVDADTRIDRNFLPAMNEKLDSGAEIVQGYFGIMNPEDSWLTRLSVVTGAIKFHLRYSCKTILGLSCPLMGNGMCFDRGVIARYGWNAFSLTENWEYYSKLVCDGYVPTYQGCAVIYSHAVIRLRHGEVQRKRWVRGRMQTSLKYVPKLLAMAVKRKSLVPLDAAIELLLPSHSMLLNWSLLTLFLSLGLGYAGWKFPAADLVLTVNIGIQLAIFALGLVMSQASAKTWASLPMVPIFLAWRLFVTIKAVFERRKSEWEKTNRILKP